LRFIFEVYQLPDTIVVSFRKRNAFVEGDVPKCKLMQEKASAEES
jgi:hypothetical protein